MLQRINEVKQANLTHDDLIAGCLKGKPAAQKQLYELFASRMYFLCLRYARDSDEANDMLQEGFVKLFSQLGSFRGEGAFEGWVRRIFVNTAIKYYQKMKRHSGHSEMTDRLMISTTDNVISVMSANEIQELISRLPDGYRMVFNLSTIEGYSHREIADILGIQEATSRSQLAKARRMLRLKLENLKQITL